MSTAQIALDQIRANGYDLPYHHPGKPITLLGIAFDEEKRNLADWKEERVVVYKHRPLPFWDNEGVGPDKGSGLPRPATLNLVTIDIGADYKRLHQDCGTLIPSPCLRKQ